MIDIVDLHNRAGLKRTMDEAKEAWGDGAPQFFEGLTETLSLAFSRYAERFPSMQSTNPPLNERGIAETLNNNPHKLRAFLQALEETTSPEMLVMVWRIIHGDDIKAIDMSYEESQSFRLRVQLEEQGGGQTSSYDSDKINDARLLRHLGIVEISDKPVFTGFFAHRD